MKDRNRLGDLQLAILRVLWEQGEAPASEVHKRLYDERKLAVTTIKTMLRKLEERGVVTHRENGRQFIYKPLVAEADVRDGMVDDLVQRMFGGDSTALVNHLIEAGEVDRSTLESLRELIAAKRKTKKTGGKSAKGDEE